MQTAPIIAISSLLVGFVLLAFSMCVYHLFSRRRKYLEQLAKNDFDPKSPTRVFTVMDGKVVPIQETKWATTFNNIDWPTSSTDARRSKPAERTSRNIVSDLEIGARDDRERSTDIQPQLYYLQQASDLLGCPVYSPLKPLPRIHEAQVKKNKGKLHLEQTQPPKYSDTFRSSTIKAHATASSRPIQEEIHRSTATSQPAVQVPLQNVTEAPAAVISKPLAIYSTTKNPRSSLPSSGPDQTRTRRASKQRPNTHKPQTNREMRTSLIRTPLGLLPPIVKDLPLSPIRTPEEKPTTPVSHGSDLQPSSPKLNFDMDVLKAASVSAIPPSAFHPYRFPRSGSRQPRKSYRAILKSTDPADSLPIGASSERITNIMLGPSGKGISSEREPHGALHSHLTSRNTGSLPPKASSLQNNASSNGTQIWPADPNTPLETLSWLADPSQSDSAKSSNSSRRPQQHQTNTPKTSEESIRAVRQSFLDPATPISGLVPTMPPEKHESTAGPYSSVDMAQAYRMSNARCVSIYSRYALPVSRKPVPSPLVGRPHRLSSASSWRDKPLPSPGSHDSGNAASGTAQSFVVSPLSSTFIP
ncbi:hypothetical protein MMC34_007946 [Xylographa carneopallida]|nr:hypothetical protein [Xylographa carneopallida]